MEYVFDSQNYQRNNFKTVAITKTADLFIENPGGKIGFEKLEKKFLRILPTNLNAKKIEIHALKLQKLDVYYLKKSS